MEIVENTRKIEKIDNISIMKQFLEEQVERNIDNMPRCG